MATDLNRRQALALTGAGFLASSLGPSRAASEETSLSNPAAAHDALPPGDAFARNLEALPRNVEKMLTGRAIYVDDVRFRDEAVGVSPRAHPRRRHFRGPRRARRVRRSDG
jgi:hypothetical protein